MANLNRDKGPRPFPEGRRERPHPYLYMGSKSPTPCKKKAVVPMKAVNRENYVPNLGQPCGDDARRDAVHVAVAPLVLSPDHGDAEPGDHFYVDEKGHAVHTMSMSPRAVGVLDPFRKDCIKAGSRVWGLLYPGTITGRRHVWSHSARAIKRPELQ